MSCDGGDLVKTPILQDIVLLVRLQGIRPVCSGQNLVQQFRLRFCLVKRGAPIFITLSNPVTQGVIIILIGPFSLTSAARAQKECPGPKLLPINLKDKVSVA